MLYKSVRITFSFVFCAALVACTSTEPAPSASPALTQPATISTSAPGSQRTETPTTSTGTPPPTADPALKFPPTAAPVSELLSISGKGPFVSQPIKLTNETNIRITWDQSSIGEFLLSFINLDESMANTPYGNVTYDYSVGPSSGSSDDSYVAGEYVVKIEKSDGPWEIKVEIVPLEQ